MNKLACSEEVLLSSSGVLHTVGDVLVVGGVSIRGKYRLLLLSSLRAPAVVELLDVSEFK